MTSNQNIGRRPTAHLSPQTSDEIDGIIAYVAEQFGEPWLCMQVEHPVGALWARRDWAATNQLVILGRSLQWAHKEWPKWLAGQVKLIKSKDANCRRGAMLEVISLYMLRQSGSGIAPTPRSFPGYDAIIAFPDGAELAISIKNYGMSQHERSFRGEARKIEKAFIARLNAIKLSGIVLAATTDRYPHAEDWKALLGGLQMIVTQSTRVGEPHSHGIWQVWLQDTPPEVRPLSKHHLSHQIFIAVPFHPNEEKNLLDKLDEAAANASKHAVFTPKLARAVFIRLPESIPAETCKGWAEAYFRRNPESPVDIVLLYQVVTVQSQDSSQLYHTFLFQPSPNLPRWLAPDRCVKFDVSVGAIGVKPSEMRLGSFDGALFEEGYVFQHGLFYTASGPSGGNIRHIAPGIIQRPVVTLPQGSFVVEGLFPPTSDVTLFD